MKNLDLEKLIILISLVLMPVAGWFAWSLNAQIKVADLALRKGPRESLIVDIVALQEKISRTKKQLSTKSDRLHGRTYFEDRLARSQKGTPIVKQEDMVLNATQPRKVLGEGRLRNRKIGEDIEMKIKFNPPKGQKGLFLPRSFINAFLVNCESGAPIWKLRHVRIVNSAFTSKNKNPPLETPDTWTIPTLVFARVRPVAPVAKTTRRKK